MKPAVPAAHLERLAPEADVRRTHRLLDFVSLTKPRLNLLVLLTTLGGLYLAKPEGLSASIVLHTMLGTALVAGGAAALNHVWERNTDRLMRRTSNRPVASRRLQVAEGSGFGIALAAAGLFELWSMVNVTAAWVAGVTLVSYVLFYTPLKIRSSLSTLVGAVPGALPPVIGWAGATGEIGLPAMVLFGIVFFWQMPHFLAIAWMHRADYARAGIPLLPVLEPDGRRTGRQALQYALALGPVSLMPVLVQIAGPMYAAVAVLLWGFLLNVTVRFARQRTNEHARALFLYSIAYLALLWMALVVDRLWL
jgi:protoheme IX farnesyltransferase